MSKGIHDTMKKLKERPIAYWPVLARLTGSVSAGLLCSQLLYWHGTVRREFYKTDVEIMAETGMGSGALRTAKGKLRKLPGVEIVRKSMPARTYYRIDEPAILAQISSFVESAEQGPSFVESTEHVTLNQQNMFGRNSASTSETTQRLPETTTPPNAKRLFGEFVLLSEWDHQKLVEQFGKEEADYWIDELNNAIGSGNKKAKSSKSHYHTILNWKRRDDKDRQSGQSNRGKTQGIRRRRLPSRPDTDFNGSADEAGCFAI